MSTIRYNKSKTYLLPLLSEVVQFDLTYFSSLENTYVFDDANKYKDCIYLLHKTNFKDENFTQYEHNLLNNDFFVNLVDTSNNSSVYIFNFPKEYIHEYNMFIDGRYSHFGEDAKKLILAFWGELYQNNLNAVNFLLKVKQILFKDDKLRRQLEQELGTQIPDDAELTDKIEKEEETCYISMYDKKMIIKS